MDDCSAQSNYLMRESCFHLSRIIVILCYLRQGLVGTNLRSRGCWLDGRAGSSRLHIFRWVTLSLRRFPIRRTSNPTLIIIITKNVSQLLYNDYLSHDLSSSGNNECSGRSMSRASVTNNDAKTIERWTIGALAASLWTYEPIKKTYGRLVPDPLLPFRRADMDAMEPMSSMRCSLKFEVSFKGKSSLFSIFRLRCRGSFSFLATLGTFDTNSYWLVYVTLRDVWY